jgi:hypothetical protein
LLAIFGFNANAPTPNEKKKITGSFFFRLLKQKKKRAHTHNNNNKFQRIEKKTNFGEISAGPKSFWG